MQGFKSITIKYGVSVRSATVPEQATMAEIIADRTNKAVLGYGDNVQGLVYGVVQDNSSVVPDGATVEIEAKANQKAALV